MTDIDNASSTVKTWKSRYLVTSILSIVKPNVKHGKACVPKKENHGRIWNQVEPQVFCNHLDSFSGSIQTSTFQGEKKKAEKAAKVKLEKDKKAKEAAAKAAEAVQAEESRWTEEDDAWWDEWQNGEDDGEPWSLDDVPPYEGCNSGFPGEGVGS